MSAQQVPNLTDLFAENLKEAEAGNLCAWADVGYAYLYGMGTDQDIDKALGCFRKGAEAGDARACYAIYETWSDGVSLVSEDEAMKMCRRAASRGHKKAAFALEQN